MLCDYFIGRSTRIQTHTPHTPHTHTHARTHTHTNNLQTRPCKNTHRRAHTTHTLALAKFLGQFIFKQRPTKPSSLQAAASQWPRRRWRPWRARGPRQQRLRLQWRRWRPWRARGPRQQQRRPQWRPWRARRPRQSVYDFRLPIHTFFSVIRWSIWFVVSDGGRTVTFQNWKIQNINGRTKWLQQTKSRTTKTK